MSQSYKIVGLGELLWDMLPSGKQLGGAPANFAYISSLLGNEGIVSSRVGDDALGKDALARLSDLNVSSEFVQVDSVHPTGTVQVKVDHAGQPQFSIGEGAAWDFMQWTPGWRELASRIDAVCFGSLAQRTITTRATIHQFLAAVPATTLRVFD